MSLVLFCAAGAVLDLGPVYYLGMAGYRFVPVV